MIFLNRQSAPVAETKVPISRPLGQVETTGRLALDLHSYIYCTYMYKYNSSIYVT